MMILLLKKILYSAISHLILKISQFSQSKNNDFKATLMESVLINTKYPPFNKNEQSLPLELFEIKEQSFIIWWTVRLIRFVVAHSF